MNPITLVLTRDGDEIKRQFVPSLVLTNFGKALKKLDSSILEKEFPGVPLPELKPNAPIFQKPQDVPWYLDKIGRELFKDNKKRYRLQVKACEGFLYIRLKVQNGRKWKLLISPFFQESPLPKSPAKPESTRGFADTLLFAAPNLKKKRGKDAGELLKWYEIDIVASCEKRTSKRLTLAFAPKVKVFPGEVHINKKCIDYQDSKGRTVPVLVASRNVRAAIKALAEAWHNPLPRSVLLSAWTGSGKEVLKSLFLYACRVPEDRVMEFAAPELAASADHCEQIFGKLESQKLFDATKKEKGLYDHCVLFLDEIHHPEVAKLRRGLLRSMEIDRITYGKDEVDTKLLTYLFAASKSPEQLGECPPPDFWNRIEYNVVMNHPLRLASSSERSEALQQYFCLFWRDTAKKRKRTNDKNDKNDETEAYIEALKKTAAISLISKKFVAVLGSPLIPMISMRTIRTIVARLFGLALYLAQTDKPKNLAKAVADHMDDWATEIFRQIVPELKPEGLF